MASLPGSLTLMVRSLDEIKPALELKKEMVEHNRNVESSQPSEQTIIW